VSLAALYTLMQLAKLIGVIRFFARRAGLPPARWPSISLIQPITGSENDLAQALRLRFRLDYPAGVQHLLVCDEYDAVSQSVCRSVLGEFPTASAETVRVEGSVARIASKTEKMLAALQQASGDVLVFVDDDILLPPFALQVLVSRLEAPAVGVVFGLACYTNWSNLWSGLMSAFVNSNALLNYIPLTYLTEPFTVTGHCFALSRTAFTASGGFDGMAERVDDDHEIARRVRALGLHLVQTPLIYEVDNRLSSLHAYLAQMKRWFVMPRQTMLPYLTRRESTLMILASADVWLPPLLAVLAIVLRGPSAIAALISCLVVLYGVNAVSERLCLHHSTPLRWAHLRAVSAMVAPFLMLAAILGDDRIEWRGRHLLLRRDGHMEPIP
jgi:ceramide glucosyltransferase